MATILPFEPDNVRHTSRRASRMGPATIVPFPGVRYERMPPEEDDTGNDRKKAGKRAAPDKALVRPEY